MSSIVLVGFMGSGKTTVGRALADRFNRPFIDLDEQIVAAEGRPIADIFQTSGESVFRNLERKALKEAVALACSVVATGGGVFDDPDNRRVIAGAGGWTVFLDASWSTLADRLGLEDADRPLWSSAEQAKALFERRRPSYRLADATVVITSDSTVSEVVGTIVKLYSEARCDT